MTLNAESKAKLLYLLDEIKQAVDAIEVEQVYHKPIPELKDFVTQWRQQRVKPNEGQR